ncbi:hypothetical protein [Streptomyces sp. NBC_00019]|uniref:hypothetical protein n=1 Tax=Streptomyces sp. NBC_00019 TaxID=2975623 RepID=UPI0032548632
MRCGRALGNKRRLKELMVAAAVDIAAYCTAKILTPCTREMFLVIQVDDIEADYRQPSVGQGAAVSAARP